MAAVTQKSIAERLGINPVTVAYALSDNPRVSLKTRERVRRMAAELGYSPNRAAQALRGGRTGILAVAKPPASFETPVMHAPYYEAFMRGIEIEAAHRDLAILTCPSYPGVVPGIVRAGGIDGVIAFIADPTSTALFRTLDRPVVWMGAMTDYASDITLAPDQSAAIGLTTRHLQQLGHRRIAYLGYFNVFQDAVIRCESYRAAMREAGLADERLVAAAVEGNTTECLTAEIRRLWDTSGGFTAMVCYHDAMAMTAVRVLDTMGLRVPEDVSVTGLDDISSAFHFLPTITSVSYDRVAMGRRAVEMISGDCETKSEVYPVTFEARGSTCELISAHALHTSTDDYATAIHSI